MSTYSKQEMLTRLGHLAEQRRGEIGLGRVKFAEEAGIGSDATVKSFERGDREPNVVSQNKFERALKWQNGIIFDLLGAADREEIHAIDIDMEYLDGWKAGEPFTRASQLDDVELLTELIRRLEGWKSLLEPAPATQHEGVQDDFRLVADDTKGSKRFKDSRDPEV